MLITTYYSSHRQACKAPKAVFQPLPHTLVDIACVLNDSSKHTKGTKCNKKMYNYA